MNYYGTPVWTEGGTRYTREGDTFERWQVVGANVQGPFAGTPAAAKAAWDATALGNPASAYNPE